VRREIYYTDGLINSQLSTGRSISTSASHLQPITSLVCDPNSNFILSGAADSNVHVWSLPNILSFHLLQSSDLGGTSALTPLHTLSNHRAPVTCIAVGHSKHKCNIAISASRDNNALVWEYRTGTLLRTILLPATPLCLTLDPADRALLVGYEDGTLQSVDFFSAPSLGNPLHDPKAQSISLQLNESDRWLSPIADIGSTNCIATTYDGITFLSGHACGKVLSWDVAKRKYVSEVLDLASPVTNLRILHPSGFLRDTEPLNTTLHTTVKARYDHMLSGGAQQNGYTIPPSYMFTAQFSCRIAVPNLTASSSPSSSVTDTSSQADLMHSSFPDSLITEGLSELSAWNKKPDNEHSEDVIMLENPPEDSALAKLTNENALLQEKIETYEAERKRTWSHLIELNTVNFDFRQREAQRQRRSRRRKEARLVQEENERGEWLKKNGVEGEGEGEEDEDVEAGVGAADSKDGEGLDDNEESSSADEMTESE
jgi:pre-rRNA-processing protein IPI3